MTFSITNWFKKSFSKEDSSDYNSTVISNPCAKDGNCLESLQVIMDGEATPEDQKYFLEHINECMPCYQFYHLETTIKVALQTKISPKEVPTELIEAIKDKVKQSVV